MRGIPEEVKRVHMSVSPPSWGSKWSLRGGDMASVRGHGAGKAKGCWPLTLPICGSVGSILGSHPGPPTLQLSHHMAHLDPLEW